MQEAQGFIGFPIPFVLRPFHIPKDAQHRASVVIQYDRMQPLLQQCCEGRALRGSKHFATFLVPSPASLLLKLLRLLLYTFHFDVCVLPSSWDEVKLIPNFPFVASISRLN